MRPGRNGRARAASGPPEPAGAQPAGTGVAAARACEATRPAQPLQVVEAVRIGSGTTPADAQSGERGHVHVVPRKRYTPALDETRSADDDQTTGWGLVRC